MNKEDFEVLIELGLIKDYEVEKLFRFFFGESAQNLNGKSITFKPHKDKDSILLLKWINTQKNATRAIKHLIYQHIMDNQGRILNISGMYPEIDKEVFEEQLINCITNPETLNFPNSTEVYAYQKENIKAALIKPNKGRMSPNVNQGNYDTINNDSAQTEGMAIVDTPPPPLSNPYVGEVKSEEENVGNFNGQSAQTPMPSQSAQAPTSRRTAQAPTPSQSAQAPTSRRTAQAPTPSQSAQAPTSRRTARESGDVAQDTAQKKVDKRVGEFF